MRSIVLENKTGIWILGTDSQLEFGHHVVEFGYQQCDTLSSGTGRINRNPNWIAFSSVYGKYKADHPPFGLLMLCSVELPRVNQLFLCPRSEFICRVSPCSPSTRQVKLYLIKMLCSLPNSSPHIWFPLFVFCGWARTSTPLNQSLLKRENIWVTFLHVVWYDKAAAAPVRTGWELGKRERELPEFNRNLLSFCITVTTSTWAFKLLFSLPDLHVLCGGKIDCLFLFYYLDTYFVTGIVTVQIKGEKCPCKPCFGAD